MKFELKFVVAPITFASFMNQVGSGNRRDAVARFYLNVSTLAIEKDDKPFPTNKLSMQLLK